MVFIFQDVKSSPSWHVLYNITQSNSLAQRQLFIWITGTYYRYSVLFLKLFPFAQPRNTVFIYKLFIFMRSAVSRDCNKPYFQSPRTAQEGKTPVQEYHVTVIDGIDAKGNHSSACICALYYTYFCRDASTVYVRAIQDADACRRTVSISSDRLMRPCSRYFSVAFSSADNDVIHFLLYFPRKLYIVELWFFGHLLCTPSHDSRSAQYFLCYPSPFVCFDHSTLHS